MSYFFDDIDDDNMFLRRSKTLSARQFVHSTNRDRESPFSQNTAVLSKQQEQSTDDINDWSLHTEPLLPSLRATSSSFQFTPSGVKPIFKKSPSAEEEEEEYEDFLPSASFHQDFVYTRKEKPLKRFVTFANLDHNRSLFEADYLTDQDEGEEEEEGEIQNFVDKVDFTGTSSVSSTSAPNSYHSSSPLYNQHHHQLNVSEMPLDQQNRLLRDLVMQQNALLQQQQQQVNFSPSASFQNYLPTPPSLLSRHKTCGYRPSLMELRGHVVEFSRDSHGSRLVQSMAKEASQLEKEMLVSEVLTDSVALMQDLFGNYVIQNFLEHCCSEGQKIHLCFQIKQNMDFLCFHPHGCRVVQKAIECFDSKERNSLMEEVTRSNEQILRCAKDPHATHVFQKAVVLLQQELTREWSEDNALLLSKIEVALSSVVLNLVVHPHACRLVQKVLGDCTQVEETKSQEVKEMLAVVQSVFPSLCVDQHGNFILQHLLDHGDEKQRESIQLFVTERMVELSQHKFGSHLVEKCLKTANRKQADGLVNQLLLLAKRKEEDLLMRLMKDPYANFVVQRAFDATEGNEKLRSSLQNEVRKRHDVLSRFAYGRHIISHILR